MLIGVDDSHTIGSKGGSNSIDIGQNTDLSAGIFVDENGNFQVAPNSSYHDAAEVKTGYAVDTRAPINWIYKTTRRGVKVVGTLPIDPPYIAVYYWRRIA